MANSIKARLDLKGDVVTVKTLITHPMSVERKDPKTGATIEAHFIEEVTCTHAGKPVVVLACGQAIAMNPFIEMQFAGARKGDAVTVSWRDNKGQTDSASLTL